MTALAEQAGQLATVLLHPANAKWLEETLDAIALWSKPGCDIPPVAEAAACKTFTPEQKECAWQDFQAAVIRLEDIATGARHWCEFWDEDALPPADTLAEAAEQLAAEDVDRCRAWLLTGLARW